MAADLGVGPTVGVSAGAEGRVNVGASVFVSVGTSAGFGSWVVSGVVVHSTRATAGGASCGSGGLYSRRLWRCGILAAQGQRHNTRSQYCRNMLHLPLFASINSPRPHPSRKTGWSRWDSCIPLFGSLNFLLESYLASVRQSTTKVENLVCPPQPMNSYRLAAVLPIPISFT